MKQTDSLLGSFNKTDFFLLIFFLTVSIGFQLLHNTLFFNHILTSSDGENIACFIAGRIHQDIFTGDGLLGQPENTSFYLAAQVFIISALYKLTGDIGTAISYLFGITIFLHLTAFYLLGRKLLKNRPHAALFTIVLLCGIKPIWSYWGLGAWDITPRMMYGPFLGILLYLTLKMIDSVPARMVIMFALGLSMFIHPVSVPPVAVSLFLSFLIIKKEKTSHSRNFMQTVASGIIFLFGAYLYVASYFNSVDRTERISFETFKTIISYRFPHTITEYKPALSEFFNTYFIQYPVISIALVMGFTALIINRDKNIKILLAWFAGPFIVAGLFIADQAIADIRNSLPLENNFIRALRFTIPFSIMIIMYSSISLARTFTQRTETGKKAVLLAILILINSFVIYKQFNAGYNILSLRIAKAQKYHNADYVEALDFIKYQLPQNTKIYNIYSDSLSIRYYALKPLVHTFKDGASLIYSNHIQLKKWYNTAREHSQVAKAIRKKQYEKAFKAACVLGISLNSDYMLLPTEILNNITHTEVSPHTVLSNDLLSLIRLTGCP